MTDRNAGERVSSEGVDIDVLRRQEEEARDCLLDRQQQFAVMIGVEPELLRGLRFCHACHGEDYQWTDICFSNLAEELLDPEMNADDYIAYRNYQADVACRACEGSGWEGGDFELGKEDWIALSQTGLG